MTGDVGRPVVYVVRIGFAYPEHLVEPGRVASVPAVFEGTVEAGIWRERQQRASEDWRSQKLLASQIHPIDRRSKPAVRKTRIDMFNQLSGATRLFPIIGDPVKYVESPVSLTRTFGERRD